MFRVSGSIYEVITRLVLEAYQGAGIPTPLPLAFAGHFGLALNPKC